MVILEANTIVALCGLIIAPNIKTLEVAGRLLRAPVENYKWHKGLPKKLKKLADDLQGTMTIVSSLRNIHHAMIDTRLSRLREVIDDADDILDSLVYEIHAADLKKRHTLDSSIHLAKTVIGLNSSGQLEKVLSDVGELHKTARQLLQDSSQPLITRGITYSARTVTAPQPVKDKMFFFGYDGEYNQLVSKLRGGEDVVIAIIGHGGMGKTELARQAYRDVQDRFHLSIWVHAYNKFTETELLREICKSASPPSAAPAIDTMNLCGLQLELGNLLASKRCLLVLDDVWHHESTTDTQRKEPWKIALAPFLSRGTEGSRIVMTTRAKICSTTLDAGACISLDGIDAQAATLLLKKTAFGDEQAHLRPQLQQVIENHAGRLQGSPLAAEAAVNDNELKNSENASRWEETLKKHHHDTVVLSHLLSYESIPQHLQRCLAFCGMFPYNWRFEPARLTKMWVAHGFVDDEEQQDGKSVEDVARGYFDALLSRSLFQQKNGGDRGTKSYYVIDEQIHSMIREVSSKYCMSIRGTRDGAAEIVIPATVRHLSVSADSLAKLKPNESGGLKKPRTLLVLNDDPSSPLNAIDDGVLKKFKGVRVLDLSETSITQLPKSIGELKHVRYLDLPSTMDKLCDQVTELLFLQTLSLGKDCKLKSFPDGMNRLINMRHLDVDMKYIAQIRGIRWLDKLQGSVEFHAGRENRVSELAGINSLRGMVSIKGIETVASNQEAMEAQLTKKASVQVLELEWAALNAAQVGAAAASSATDVLEGLQPHPRLHELRITRYPGTVLPAWLANRTVLQKLRRLYLTNCRKLQALPALGELPLLKLLHIKELRVVERIDHGLCGSGQFPSLEKIVLSDMEKLVGWDNMAVVFPKLRDVTISDCPLLSSLAGLGCCRETLSSVRIQRCPAITEASLPPNFTSNGFPSLATGRLQIMGCTLQLDEMPA